MGHIHALPEALTNMIAAGEVVENIQTVVKELVENSLDASATQIEVDLKDAGLQEIRITDNGDGMDTDDLKLSIARHATSKIARAEDLFRVLSLGFRGEALASLASVAHLSIASSPTKAASQVLTVNDDGVQLSRGKAFKGTQIIVDHLFYKTPARLKYLKAPAQELTGVLETMFHLAIARSDVAFHLRNDGKTVLKTQGDGQVKRVLYDLYGANILQSMHPFSASDRDYHIEGYYGDPMTTRSSSKHMHLFANGRAVRNRTLIQAIKEAYAPYIPTAKYPVVVAFITCDPILLDVNVHPQKKLIKLAEEARLKTTIREALAAHLMDTSKAASFKRPAQEMPAQTRLESLHESVATYDTADPLNETSNQPFPILEYVGQVHGTYLVMQSTTGLYLLDQHAAAERIRYEQYKAAMQSDRGMTKPLLTPLEIPLSVLETRELAAHLDTFKAFGLTVTLSNHALSVSEIPYFFHPEKEYDYTLNMIERLLNGQTLERAHLIDQIAKDLSCKHSIKGNAYISNDEVTHLITDLSACAQPYQCPHGRPTMIEFSQRALENMFGRTMA